MDILVLAVNLVHHRPLMRMIYGLAGGLEQLKMSVDCMNNNSKGDSDTIPYRSSYPGWSRCER